MNNSSNNSGDLFNGTIHREQSSLPSEQGSGLESELDSDQIKHQFRPLADRMRPQQLEHFVGQKHLLAKNSVLNHAIVSGQLHSMILWGPPGTGKTTLARLIAHYCEADFFSVSAVLSGVKDIRAAIGKAQNNLQQQIPSILFVDEVHRFNKAQQDAFLPYVEDGTVTFIGATTENPSFELNNALLSRARVYVLKPLTVDDILRVIERALLDQQYGLGELDISFSDICRTQLAQHADGDVRRALNYLEIATQFALAASSDKIIIDETIIKQVVSSGLRRFDKAGEVFYDQISALHKSVRGSSPDAALYWFARMLDGGCDPLYIARRVVRMASEDIGNADPRALQIALNAWDVQQRLGSPEGELAIAQAITFLACAAKSNALYKAFNTAKADAKQFASLAVPLHLRNAPTKLMKQLDYGKFYRYAHDEPDAYAAAVDYFPDEMCDENTPQNYYNPVARGLEIKIAERLNYLRQRDQLAKAERKKS